MKNIVLFLFIVIFVNCQTVQDRKERIEKIKQLRKEQEKKIVECILNSDKASSELKKIIEKNKEEHVMRFLHPRGHKLDDNDRKAIKDCRISVMEEDREEFIRKRDSEKKKHEKDINADNL